VLLRGLGWVAAFLHSARDISPYLAWCSRLEHVHAQVITPHNSGNPDGMAGAGPRYMAQSLRYFRAQLRRYLNGDKVFNVVDNAVGY
jgi:hypothetical protein